MSTGWKAGDRALCVERFNNMDVFTNRAYPDEDTPVVGIVYLVDSVNPVGEEVGLKLAGMQTVAVFGYTAKRFRRLVPACDRASIAQEATP
jgi:hypothetical protein